MSDGGGNRWLRNHFHEFVFPAFMAAEKRSTEIGEPFHVKASPQAPEHLPSELKKLWTLCMDHKIPWEFDVREINIYGGHSKYRESARIHHKVLSDTLDSAMAALRTEGCSRLFYGGRDVWTFAVLSAKRKVPYLFVPELSRNVVGRPDVKPFLEERGFTGEELFLDTGFAGSIPRALERYWGKKFCFRLMSQSDVHIEEKGGHLVDCDPASGQIRKQLALRWRRRPNQIFPNHNQARATAVETEYLAKYWRAGTYGSTIPTFVGQVADVFDTWTKKTNVRRVSTKKPGWIALYDGKEIVEVSLADARQLAPLLIAWMAALPEIAIGPEKVIQYFSDRRTIQRAALLTSMLWRGIPFWKAAMSRTTAAKGVGYFNAGPNVAQFTNAAAVGTSFNIGNTQYVINGGANSTNIITDMGTIGLSPGFSSQTTNASTWPPTAATVDPAQYLAQFVGQPLTPQLQHHIAAVMAKAEAALGDKGPKPSSAKLPPSKYLDPTTLEMVGQADLDPWTIESAVEAAPIKPSPIIFVNPEFDEIDAGWELAPA